ncbi:MAG: phosphatase PAP2 family protein [Thioalkalivibrionaceae bacterium]
MVRYVPTAAVAILLVLYVVFFLVDPTDRAILRQMGELGWTAGSSPATIKPLLDALYTYGPWPGIVIASVALIMRAAWLLNDLSDRRASLDSAARCSRRRLTYLVLAFLIGPGLIVNAAFKDHFGRARPAQTIEFGGHARYSPPGLPVSQCARNCSFPSGHAAAAFYPLAVAFLLSPPWRRRLFFAAILWGSAVGVTRVLQGAHWPSDVVGAFLIVYLTSAALHRALLGRCPDCPLLCGASPPRQMTAA